MAERYKLFVVRGGGEHVIRFQVADWSDDQLAVGSDRNPPFAQFEIPYRAPADGFEYRMALKYAEAVCESLNREFHRIDNTEVKL